MPQIVHDMYPDTGFCDVSGFCERKTGKPGTEPGFRFPVSQDLRLNYYARSSGMLMSNPSLKPRCYPVSNEV